MKVFISQPMHGLSEEFILNRMNDLFALVKEKYPDAELIDNYTKPQEIVNKGRLAMLGDSIALMADADIVLFADGWMGANGCVIENIVALRYHIRIIYEAQLRPKPVEAEYYWGC